MSLAIERRLRALELRAGTGARPSTAFVIRADNSDQANEMLARAIASNQVRSGDPVLILTCIGFGEAEWQDIADLSLADLAALAEGGQHSHDATRLSDNELHAAIVDSLPRVA
jgi:hypothetical protein